MTTPNPAPDERAGWRSEYLNPPADWTPPHGAPADGPVVPGSAVGRAYVPAPPFPHEPLASARELFIALGVAAFVALAGFPLGWLWSAIAPKTPVQMIADVGAVLSQPEQEQMIADEGWYLFLTVLAGVLVAALAWAFLRRYRGVPMVVALAVGGVVGGSIAAWFGHHIGYAHFRDLAAHAPVGTSFSAPVSLRVKQAGWWHDFLPYARGDVLAMAIAALVIYLLLVGFSAYPSLRGPDPAPLVDVAPGDGYPGYPPAGRFGEVGPGTAQPSPFSSDL